MLDPDNIDFIPLTQGMYAIVDMADSERVSAFRWYAHRQKTKIYAKRFFRVDGRRVLANMGRFILGVSDGVVDRMVVDHINGDGLDNRRENLRLCLPSENMKNRLKDEAKNFSSKFKGVSVYKRPSWQARIRVDRTTIFLGYFDSEIAAALAYDAAAKKYFGEYARLNFPL